MKIRALRCLKCGCIIYSRCRHDMRWCTCQSIAIDGGFDYWEVTGRPHHMAEVAIQVAATRQELMRDYNTGVDKFGLIPALSCVDAPPPAVNLCSVCGGDLITNEFNENGEQVTLARCERCKSCWIHRRETPAESTISDAEMNLLLASRRARCEICGSWCDRLEMVPMSAKYVVCAYDCDCGYTWTKKFSRTGATPSKSQTKKKKSGAYYRRMKRMREMNKPVSSLIEANPGW